MEEIFEKKPHFIAQNPKEKFGHAKNNSALVKIMAPKENEILEAPKQYESLIRGGKRNLFESKTFEKK